MSKHINTSLAMYQTRQPHKPAADYHARPTARSHVRPHTCSDVRSFDLSIAQLENWPIRPIRTRRNGSTGLRRDIKRCIQGSVSIAQGIWTACDPLFKLLKKANTTLDKVQLSHAEPLYTDSLSTGALHTGALYTGALYTGALHTASLQAGFLHDNYSQTACLNTESLNTSSSETSRSHVNMHKNTQQDLFLPTQDLHRPSSTRIMSTKPMQQIVQPNLLKDSLATAVWIIIAPTVMILGTVAGY